MHTVHLEPLEYRGAWFKRTFCDTGTRNDLNCNLTELRAASDSVSNDADETHDSIGFTRHPDWISHLNRYAYAGRVIDRLKPATILDVGCGELQLPFYLNKNRYKPASDTQYFGLELRATDAWLGLDAAGRPKSRYKANMTLVKGDIVRDDFSLVPGWPVSGFPLVISLETFEHVPVAMQPEFMQRLFQWTAPGGTCLFSTPNAGVSVSTAANHHDPVTGEVRERSYPDKVAMAQEVGFELAKSYGTFTGKSYLPAEVQEKLKTDPMWVSLHEFLDTSLYNCIIAAAYPTFSNNALMVLRRP